MIIDAHGHYTTYPTGVEAYRGGQVAALAAPAKGAMKVSDDEIRESIEGAQLRVMRERGTDLTLFSPRATWLGHHFGGELVSRYWIEHLNELVHRVAMLFPGDFAPVCALPQSPGARPATRRSTPPDRTTSTPTPPRSCSSRSSRASLGSWRACPPDG